MKIIHVIGLYVRYILVWVSGPCRELLPRPVSSPLRSTPFLACRGYSPCLGSKEGERKTYFKTDLCYAFIMKADLFSNVQCLNGTGQQREETGVTASLDPASTPPPAPRCSLPPTAPVAEDWSPGLTPGHLPRAGRALGSPGLGVWLHCPLLMTR